MERQNKYVLELYEFDSVILYNGLRVFICDLSSEHEGFFTAEIPWTMENSKDYESDWIFDCHITDVIEVVHRQQENKLPNQCYRVESVEKSLEIRKKHNWNGPKIPEYFKNI